MSCDDRQRRGIATLLLGELAAAAFEHGITTFVAETLSENRDMIGVFINSGFPVTTSADCGTVELRVPDRAH